MSPRNRSRTAAATIAALAAVAALATACTVGAPTAAAPTTVDIVDFAFTPATLVIPVGTTVTWVNGDQFAHTVTTDALDGPASAFDGRLGERDAFAAQGLRFRYTFDEAGTFAYHCVYHPNMRGEVVVTD